MILTSKSHFDPPPQHRDDLLFEYKWSSLSGLREALEARRSVSQFSPDVVITEATWDPRYLVPLPAGVPVISITHDAVPHDVTHKVSLKRRLNAHYLDRRTTARVVFSRDVAERLEPSKTPVHIVPLTSELPEELVADEVVPASSRRNFYLVGRLSEYKNVKLCVDAMEMHRASDHYRGDRLVLVGGGDPECELPGFVTWERGRFPFSRLAELLPSAKASLCVYKAGSQSGVQVTSLQCGAPVVVSAVGGLPEYLSEGEAPLEPLTAASLARRLDSLADPGIAEAEGRRGMDTYRDRYSVEVTSKAWENILQETCKTSA